MPPRKSKASVPDHQTQTLDSFFSINRSPRPTPLPLQLTTRSQTASSSRATYESVLSSMAIDVSDSDSDDGLLDPLAILGPPTPGVKTTPTAPLTRPGLRPRASPITPATAPRTPMSAATPYRNNLQSLVRAQESKKYDLRFLDEQMLHLSDSDDDNDDNDKTPSITLLANHDVQSALPGIPKEDAERVRAQLGANVESARSPACLTLFITNTLVHMAPVSVDKRASAFATLFDKDDPVERVFGDYTDADNYHSILRRILKSGWIIAQANSGWRLTQTIGDMLLRTMCLESDRYVAHRAWLTLQTCIELRMPAWELQLDTFFLLLEELQGKLCDRANDDRMSNDSQACQSDSSSTSSSLSVYVAVVVPRHSCIARASAERVAFMLDIAARSLDLSSVADSCRAITMFAASLLDHGNCLYHLRMQQSLASLLDRVSPASKWSLVWGELVAELGRLFVHLQIQTQLGIVEQLPASNKRCMQIRRSLSFLFLRKQSLDDSESDMSLDSLARAATLPSQIVLRVVSEMMHSGEQPFRVDASVDFAQLEAAVGLLSNILDDTQAMYDVRDVARAIYQRLCAINRRISDGIADNIDKTLAKDAVQTLVVRLFMSVISDSTERLNPVYSSARTLDNWLNVS
ncbi:hypothetical protein GGI14_004664 [Coemansia sp. S680]|nr:hypothetical protein GGI14_004664 [Coemansia sp. S680]